MAITSWRQNLSSGYTGPNKWGTGVNKVHADKDDGTGRVMEPGQAPVGLPMNSPLLNGWTQEDLAATGDFGFMDQHPNWGIDPERGRADFPSWGHRYGPPAGTGTRAKKRGMNQKEIIAQQVPSETVTEGWTNKNHGAVLDSRPSDVAQYERQTSMQQRDAVQVNDAAVARGTDAARASIPSRITGMKVKNFSGQERHEDMTPWVTDVWHRVFRVRTAGTADPAMMNTNEMYVSSPMTRTVPADVNQGDAPESSSGDYGYVDGDYYV